MAKTGAKIIESSKGIFVDEDLTRSLTGNFMRFKIAEVPAA